MHRESAAPAPSVEVPNEAALVGSLLGRPVPQLTLESTWGPVDLADLGAAKLVLFIYPHATGLPDAPVAGWDLVPGARGCTAQSCAFRDSQQDLEGLGAMIAGLSVQTVDEQRAFAERVGVRYRLISDPALRLALVLGLPTFEVSGRTFYRRITLLVRAGRIAHVIYPIPEPERNAADVMAWLERNARAW